jgi:hypothetical protein
MLEPKWHHQRRVAAPRGKDQRKTRPREPGGRRIKAAFREVGEVARSYRIVHSDIGGGHRRRHQGEILFEQCPGFEAKRKTSTRDEYFAI